MVHVAEVFEITTDKRAFLPPNYFLSVFEVLRAMMLINSGPSLVWKHLSLIKSVALYINYGTDLNSLESAYLFSKPCLLFSSRWQN